MSDLRDLPDLAGSVRDRTAVPPYEEVTRRVRARRGRVAAGTVAAVVLVAGGLGFWQFAADPVADPRPPAATTGPTPPDPTPVDESWREVVTGTLPHPFEVSGSDDGSIAVVWRALEPGSPTFALVVQDAGGDLHGRRLEEPVSLTPVPGGWVGTYSSRAWLITTDGGWTALSEPGPARDPRPGDVLVRGEYTSWLYSPAERSLAAMPGLDGSVADAYVTPDGRTVGCAGERDGVHVLGGGEQAPVIPGDTCVVAGRGDAVAVLGLGDDPDGGIPMTGLATYGSGGWRQPSIPHPLGGVTSVVVTPEGSTVVTDASTGRWYVVRADGEVARPDRKVGLAFVAGDRLYVTPDGFQNGPLAYTTDGGRTWTETTLPGSQD